MFVGRGVVSVSFAWCTIYVSNHPCPPPSRRVSVKTFATQDMGTLMMVEHMERVHGVKPYDVRYYYMENAGGVRSAKKKKKRAVGTGCEQSKNQMQANASKADARSK